MDWRTSNKVCRVDMHEVHRCWSAIGGCRDTDEYCKRQRRGSRPAGQTSGQCYDAQQCLVMMHMATDKSLTMVICGHMADGPGNAERTGWRRLANHTVDSRDDEIGNNDIGA